MESIDFTECLMDDNDIWAITSTDSFLYRINKCTHEVSIAAMLIDNPSILCGFGKILPYGDKLVFLPSRANEIVIYDKKESTRENIKLPKKTEELAGNSGWKFLSGTINRNYLYMFGCAYAGILRVNLKDGDCTIMDRFMSHKELTLNNQDDGFIFKKYIIKDKKVYCPFMNSNVVLIFSLDTECTQIVQVGDSSQRYISIEEAGDSFWLIPRDASHGSIVSWNPESKISQVFHEYPKKFNFEKYAFYRTAVAGNQILLFANRSNMNIKVDALSGAMDTFEDPYEMSHSAGCKYGLIDSMQDKILIVDAKRNLFFFYDGVQSYSSVCQYTIPDIVKRICKLKSAWSEKLYGNHSISIITREKKEFNLDDMVLYLTLASGRKGKKQDGIDDNSAGKKVHEMIKNVEM